MTRFRHHRGNLYDSLETTIDNVYGEEMTLKNLEKYLEYEWGVIIQDIKQEYYCYDERCEWDTWLISIKINDKFCVAGMTDGELYAN